MRLIHTETLELVEFFGNKIPEYAILSHTWGHSEVTFKDWKRLDAAKGKAGFSKLEMACRQASKDGFDYLWADTNCIDKRSSAELSEAINSMFSWYKNAAICYAYLADVEPFPSMTPTEYYWQQFRQSRWFTRGWTLQELLAPRQMVFYAKDWSGIASRYDLADEISTATNIPEEYLQVPWLPLARASIAQRMSWLSRRDTTRVEDMAYCMLGIFDINMPLLYGEGSKAFTRLQEEIIRKSTDHTIFCWTWNELVPSDWGSLLAPCPQAFVHSGAYVRVEPNIRAAHSPLASEVFFMTNAGLSIHLPLIQTFFYHIGRLNATIDGAMVAGVPMQEYLEAGRSDKRVMRRIPFPPSPLLVRPGWAGRQLPLYIRSFPDSTPHIYPTIETQNLYHVDCSFLLLFDDTQQLFYGEAPSTRTFGWEDYDSVLSTHRAEEPMRIRVIPDECLDRRTGLISLTNAIIAERFLKRQGNDNYGVLIRLENHETSLVMFLGAEVGPNNQCLRRFGSFVPQRAMRHFALDAMFLRELLVLLNHDKVFPSLEISDTIGYSTVSGIGFEFGIELSLDGHFVSPVFLKSNRRYLESNTTDEYNSETECD